MITSFSTVIIDLDNTVYEYNTPHRIALKSALSAFASRFQLDFIKVENHFNQARKSTHLALYGQAASHSRLLYFQKLLENLNINPLKHALFFEQKYWNVFLQEMKLFEGVQTFFNQCQKKGIKVCVLTDLTSDIQFHKIEKLGLKDCIDHIVTSEEVGVEKPNPLMFFQAIYKLKTSTASTIMIGDNYKKDILGASNLGIKSIWINGDKVQINEASGSKIQSIIEVDEFKKINKLLWNI